MSQAVKNPVDMQSVKINEYDITQDGKIITIRPKANRNISKSDVQNGLKNAFTLRDKLRNDWDGMTATQKIDLVKDVLLLVLSAIIWMGQRELNRK
jgi:virulence-associated protein VagC